MVNTVKFSDAKLIFFLAVISIASSTFAATYSYSCDWDYNPHGPRGVPVTHFDFTITQNGATCSLIGLTSVNRFNYTLDTSLFTGGNVAFTLQEKPQGAKAWDYFVIGSKVEFTTGSGSVLICSVKVDGQ